MILCEVSWICFFRLSNKIKREFLGKAHLAYIYLRGPLVGQLSGRAIRSLSLLSRWTKGKGLRESWTALL